MNNKFCLLYKVEFVSLLNNLELIGISSNRLFTESKNFQSVLTTVSKLDFEEDYIILKCSIYEKDYNDSNSLFKLHITNVFELIPITQIALSAYKRKFSSNLKWTNPDKYKFEDAYKSHVKYKIKDDSKKNYNLCTKIFLKSKEENYISNELLDLIIQSKMEKYYNAKKDLDIKTNEYEHVFQSLMIYEQGSHLPRDNAFGFLLHATAVHFLHYGIGGSVKTKLNLSKSKLFEKLKSDYVSKKEIGFTELFFDLNFIDIIKKYFTQFLNNNIKVSDFNLNSLDKISFNIKVVSYFLFYQFLIKEKKISFLNVFEIIQELNGNLTEEEKVAFLLVSVDSSLASIAEDIILKNNCVTLTEQQIKRSYLDYELISKYYKTSIKSSDLIEVEYQEKNNLSIKNLNPIEEIKKSLEPFKFKNIGEKKKHFQDVILPEYANYLIESGYNIDETTKKDSIFNLIFKK
jgi:hypothetical protein